MEISQFSADERVVIETAAEFAATYLQRHARQWELERAMPRAMFQDAADAGLCGLLVPREQGGKGIGVRALLRVMEELSYADVAAAFALVVHNNHARFIASAGTQDLVSRYLPKMLAGETIGAFLLTEPQGGSDAAAISTTARADGSDYILNGEKAWITNTPHADLLNVFVQTEPGAGAKGIAAIQVPADTSGVTRLPAYDMLGGYAIGAGGFRFEDVRIGADHLLVPPGQGFRAALAGIDLARACVAAMCASMLQAGLDIVMPRLLTRRAFGQSLADQQGLQWQLADVATNLREPQAFWPMMPPG